MKQVYLILLFENFLSLFYSVACFRICDCCFLEVHAAGGKVFHVAGYCVGILFYLFVCL